MAKMATPPAMRLRIATTIRTSTSVTPRCERRRRARIRRRLGEERLIMVLTLRGPRTCRGAPCFSGFLQLRGRNGGGDGRLGSRVRDLVVQHERLAGADEPERDQR